MAPFKSLLNPEDEERQAWVSMKLVHRLQDHTSDSESRWASEGPAIIKLVQQASEPVCIPASEYLANPVSIPPLPRQVPFDSTHTPDGMIDSTTLICGGALEIREVIEKYGIVAPMFVPASAATKDWLKKRDLRGEALDLMEHREEINVNAFNVSSSDPAPLKLKGSKVATMYRNAHLDAYKNPINLLDDNTTLHDFNHVALDSRTARLIHDVHASQSKGRNTGSTTCRDHDWIINGTALSYSMPHIDTAGFATAVQVISGTKLWMWWGAYSRMELKEIGDNYDYNLKHYTPLFRILRAGDLLVQPPGYLHAVVNLTDAIASGRHLYTKQDMATSIMIAALQLASPELSNENLTKEDMGLLELIGRYWQKDEKLGHEWKARIDCSEYQRLAQKIRDTWSAKAAAALVKTVAKGCTCKPPCQASRCSCLKKKLPCTDKCDHGDAGKHDCLGHGDVPSEDDASDEEAGKGLHSADIHAWFAARCQ